jgi:hypothetical protein
VPSVARIAGWGKRTLPGVAVGAPAPGPVGAGPIAGPADPIGLKVELYLGALGWTDITRYVYYRARVRISRGRPNETSRIQPQTCAFQVNNRDGRFSPRNPNGAYYGLIGRNTQVRVSRLQNGVRRYRFHGEVVSWPTTWEISGSDVWVDVTAAGMMRRLQQGTQTLQSVWRRGVPKDSAIAAYWPCEDGANATSLASASGGRPMAVAGTLKPASYSGFLGSSPIPTLGTDQWSGAVPSNLTGTSGQVNFFVYVPAATLADGVRLASITMIGVSRVDVLYHTGGGISVQVWDATSTRIYDSGTLFAPDLDANTTRVSVTWNPHAGGGTDFSWFILVTGGTGTIGTFPTTLAPSISGVQSVGIAPDGNLGGAAVGHIWVQRTSTETGDLYSWSHAYGNEVSTSRFTRLCSEQGINAVLVAPGEVGSDAVRVGAQTVDTFSNLIQQVPDTDVGLLFESRDQLALAYRTRLSLYNQGVPSDQRRGLTLDFAQHQLSGPLNPLDDDANTRNDVTAQAISGSFAQATLDGGVLSTQPPPNGVGGYATTYSLSVGDAATSLADHAHWRLHLGTVDEPRYPQIMLNLRHPQFTGNTDLLNQALVMDVGDLVAVNNPPAWMPPDRIRQILQGYSETLGVFEHDMVLNCSPEAPYRVGVLEDKVLSRADTDGSTLAAPLGPALNANPFFAGGSLGEWSVFAGSIAAVGTSGSPNPLPAGGPSGYGALLTPDGSLSNCALSGGSTPGFYIPVAPGGSYQVSALVYSPGGYANVELGFDFYDASQSYITTSSVLSAVTAGAWTALSTSQAAGGTAAFMRPRVGEKSSPAAANTLYVAAVVAWQGAASVASTNTLLPLWTTSAGAFPFDVGVSPLGSGGERMTVTGIAGGASPQVFTVARGVNGTIVPQPAGADVRLWQPCTVSL